MLGDEEADVQLTKCRRSEVLPLVRQKP